MTRTAVIGCGDISVMHLRAIEANPDIELVAVCDTDADRLAATAEQTGVPGFTDHRELIGSGRADVVHIATPHNEHAPLAIDFLDAGIDVLLEKPMAHTLSGAQALQAAAEASDARFAVCFQNRYNAPVQALRSLLDSGALGPVLGAFGMVVWHRTAEYYVSRPWRSTWAGGGGGLLLNQAIHTLDLLQWMMGEVTEVAGTAATRSLAEAIEVEDTAEINLTHANGAHSVFFATVSHARDTPVIAEFVTEQAVLRLDGVLTVAHHDGRVETVTERTVEGGGRSYWGVSHELLINDFHAGHGSGEPFWIGADEGIKTIKIIDAVYRQSGFTPPG